MRLHLPGCCGNVCELSICSIANRCDQAQEELLTGASFTLRFPAAVFARIGLHIRLPPRSSPNIGSDPWTKESEKQFEGSMCVLITCEYGGETIPPCLQSDPPSLRSDSPWLRPDPPSLPSGGEPLTSVTELGGHGESRHPVDRAKSAVQWEHELVAKADRPARYAADRMARQLGSALRVELIVNETPSGLIDVTRPRDHRRLLSKLVRTLPRRERDQLVEQVHDGYRQRVRAAVGTLLAAHGYAIHLSVRSFNSRSRGKPRRADVSLHYDPSRAGEVAFCLDWIDEMWHRAPMLRVRRNYPRRGAGESLTGQLRAHFAGQTYLGIEVWLNRAWAGREVRLRDEAIDGMSESLHALLSAAAPTENHAA